VENPPSGEPISRSSARINLRPTPNEINARRSAQLTSPRQRGQKKSDSETGGPGAAYLRAAPFPEIVCQKKGGNKIWSFHYWDTRAFSYHRIRSEPSFWSKVLLRASTCDPAAEERTDLSQIGASLLNKSTASATIGWSTAEDCRAASAWLRHNQRWHL
jgi:hypothetical protein